MLRIIPGNDRKEVFVSSSIKDPLIPAIQTITGLSAPGENAVYKPHTPEFAVRTGTDQAVANCLDFVKGFTVTAIQLMTEPEHLEKIREEFSHINDPKSSVGFESPL